MYHRRSRLRLTQKPACAAMLLRNLATSLILYEEVRTTKKRARVVQPIVERLARAAGGASSRVAIRAINRVVTDKNASRKLMEVLRERWKGRKGGVTKIMPAGSRKGDGADLVDLTFVDKS